MRKLKFFLSLLMLFTFSVGTWAADATKTEGFETKASSTNYQGTVTVSESESDCGIGWSIFYGTVSTNDKISGTKSAQMRYYSTSDNRGYVQSTTAVDGLSNVAFKARVSSTNIKMTVSYSPDASTWTALATNVAFTETGKGIDFNYDVPSGGKYIKIEIGSGSTKPSSGNIKFIVDDVVFTYASSSPSVSVTKKDGSAIPAAGFDFGTHDNNTYDEATATYNVYDSVIIKVANADKLTSNIKLETTTSKFGVVTTSISKDDLDANGEKKVAIYARTNTDDGEYTAYLRVTSNKTPVEFDTVDVKLTHKVLGPSITFVENNTSNPITTMAFGNVGQRFQKSFVYGIQYKRLEAGNLSFEITGTDADAFAFYSDADKTVNISSAGNGSLSSLSFHQATEVVGDYSATLKVTGCGLPTAGITIPITMSVKAPEITTSVSSIDFGDLKQDEQGVLSAPKTFTLTGKYLKNGIALNCYGNLFDAGDEDGYTVINPDDDGNINATIKVRAALGWSGTYNSYLIVKGTGASPEFEDIEDLVTLKSKIIAAYPVSFQVYDNDRGTITINGKASDEYGRVKVYVVDGTEEISAKATSKLGYKFAEWQVANADKTKVTIDDKTSANATVTVSSQPEDLIWAMFEFDCTPLLRPYYPEVIDNTTTYNSVGLKWNWVKYSDDSRVATYKVQVTDVEMDEVVATKSVSFTSAQLAEDHAEYTLTGLWGNTDYSVKIWATTTEDGYCPNGAESADVEFTTADYPAATLTLSENGVERTYEGTHKLNDMIPLPSEVVTGIVGKEFMGWSASSSCSTAPEYNKGQQYKLSAVSNKLYAVYATATPGTPTDHSLGSATFNGSNTGGNTASTGYTLTTNNTGNKTGYIQDSGTKDVTIVHVQISASSQIINEQPSAIIVSAKLGGGSAKNPLGYDVYAVLVDENGDALGSSVVLTDKITNANGSDFSAELPINNYADVRGVKIYHMKEDGWNARYYNMSLKYQTGGEMSYSAYTTTGPRLLALPQFTPGEGTYTEAKNIAISAAEGTIYYNVDSDSDPTSASTAYSSAIALNTYGEHVIKAIAIDGDNKSNVATATYFMNLPFASLEALVAADLASETPNVTVSFSDVEITDINNSNRSVYLNVKDKDGVNDIQLFNYNALEESWAVGGALSGTITCTWTLFNSNWELVITSWTTGITYAKPAPTLAWSASLATVKKGATDNVFPTLTNPDALSVSYSSTDETVATIASNGDITLLKAGTTTIKASFAGNDDYRAVVVSYELTVQKAAEGVLKLYNKGVVDFGNVRVGTSSVGSEVLRVDGSKLTPYSELEVSIDGTDGYFEVQVPSDGKIDVDENGEIDYFAINIVPTSTALAQRGDISATLRLHSDDLAADSLATIKMHVGAVITVTPAEPDLAFGEVLKGDDESKYAKTVHIKITNLDGQRQIISSAAAGFKSSKYYITSNTDGEIDTDVILTPNTNTSVGQVSGTWQIFSAGSPSQFDSPMNIATMSMTMIASSAITVPDISNGSLSWDGGAAPVVAKPGSEHTLLAVPASGYTGGEIAILKAEDDSDVTDDVMSGSTLTVPSYAIKVVVSGFEAQAHPSGLGWRYGGADVTTHSHTFGTSTERFLFPSLKNPNEIDLDDIEFISSDSTVAEFGNRSHEYSSWFAAVWVKKAGTAIMTARLKNHATYDDIEVSYTLTVSKGDLTSSQFRWSQYPDIENPETDTYTWYESHSWPSVVATSYVDKANEVTYESTDESVATISSTGSITPVANGSTVIKAKFIGNDMFNAKTVQFTLNVQKASPVLSWSSTPTTSNTTVDLADSYGLYTFPRFGSVSPNAEALRDLVVLSSSDPTVAEINSNGYVNPLSAGTTTIKLSLDATDKSSAAEDISYTFTVTDSRPTLTIVAGDHGTYNIKDYYSGHTYESGEKVKATTYMYLTYLSVETGYKVPPVYKVVKTSDNTDVTSSVLNGTYLTMPAYDITVSATFPEKAVAPIGWSSTETQYAYTDNRPYTLPTLVNVGLSVTIASSNTNVATVSNGQVTVLSAGTTNISVSYAGDENYKQTTVSYELHVCSPSAITVSGGTLTHDYFENGDELTDFSGMTANLSYTNGASSVDITDVATWTATPSTIYSETEDIPAVDVQIKATYKGITGTYPNNVRCYLYTHAISYSEPAHGTIVVKKGTQEHSSWRKYLKGTVLTVEATPDAGYELATLTANGVDIMSTKQFTIGTEDVTIVATFTVALVGGECGKQGDNLLWQYNPTTKVLTITGSGEMADYTHSYSDGSNTTPWDQYRSDITSVVLPNGITSIGNWAFANFGAMTAITLPNTITVLGESAFNYSTALVSINMPSQLQTLGKMAFFNTRITSLTIPASVTSIGQQIVGAVTTLTAISVEAGNTVYDSRNNCNAIIRKSDNVLIVGCKNSTIPSDITGIADWAFDRGYAPATVELPAGVTSIGEHAFYYGRAITLLRIPVGVTSISSQAFSSAFDADGADVYVEWTTPLVVFDDIVVATNVANATLHVPYGTKSLYEVANGWKHFGTIVEADKPTGLDDAMVSGDSQVRKVIIDSKLFIIRGDKMFDAQGKLVK